MEQMTVTAKIQIVATETDKVLLDETMSVYRNACNYVSDYVFRTHDLKQFSLNKVLYSTLREKFGLKSQMAQSVLKTVIARYKTILENQSEWIKPSFKKPQYDLVWNTCYTPQKQPPANMIHCLCGTDSNVSETHCCFVFSRYSTSCSFLTISIPLCVRICTDFSLVICTCA